jgi:hypothetical protein
MVLLYQKKRTEYRSLQSKTHNGELAVEVYRSNDKQIQIIEKKLQAVKVKLSVAKTDNNLIKHVIDGLRRQKLLQFEINSQFVSFFDYNEK